ncbi:hypothetical protein C8Q72DRAFT_580582 [Fomitopsis betulina]|nr:hypothetical protein C8Q72DRAFT_580582 [Fomitopsis betulina]
MNELHASTLVAGIHPINASARDVLCESVQATILRDAESQNPSLRLPLEIQEHILDHLHDDVRTLQACCLTCTAWIPTTRLHLFRYIKLRRAKDCLRFLATLESTSDLEAGGRPSVGVLVTELLVFHKGALSGRHYDLLRQIMRRLSNVDTLCFMWFNWQSFVDLLLPDFPDYTMSSAIAAVFDFPRLKALSLWSLKFRSSAEFLALIAAFPRVETLHIKAPSCLRLPGDLAVEHADRNNLRCCLRELHIEAQVFVPGADYLAALFESLITLGSQLRKLHWGCFDPDGANGIWLARMLVRTAGTLRQLELDMRSLQRMDPIPSNGFPELRSLERLRLVYILDSERFPKPSITAFPQLLSTFRLQAVREIVVQTHWGRDGAAWDLSRNWDFIDWRSATESLLSLHQINPAATVTFVFVRTSRLFAEPPLQPAVSALAKAVARRLRRVVEAGLPVMVSTPADTMVLTPELANAQ